MKKIIALFAILGLCGAQTFAETKEIGKNNSFEAVTGDVPNNWIVNQYFKSKNMAGTIQILSTSAQDGTNCLMFKNDAKQVFHLFGEAVAAAPGNVIKMSAYVKGEGSFSLSVYLYSAKNVWLATAYGKTVNVKNTDWEKKDFVITLEDKTFGDKGKVAIIRPVIAVNGNSEICLDNFSGQVEDAPAADASKK